MLELDGYFVILTLILGCYIFFHILVTEQNQASQLFENHGEMIWNYKDRLVSFANGYIFYELSKEIYDEDVNIFCQPPQNWEAEAISRVSLGFWFVKILELSDTILLILWGSNPRVWVFLHHPIMVIFGFIALRFVPGGTTLVFCAINSLGHSIVYLLNSFAISNLHKRSWIKIVNMTQFFAALSISITSAYSNCGYPLYANVLVGSFSLALIIIWTIR